MGIICRIVYHPRKKSEAQILVPPSSTATCKTEDILVARERLSKYTICVHYPYDMNILAVT